MSTGQNGTAKIWLTLASISIFIFSCRKTGNPENDSKSFLSYSSGVRYLDDIFSGVDTSAHNILYRVVDNYDITERLALDVYLPAGDTQASRPAIIMIHGGGFDRQIPEEQNPPTNGTRKDPLMVDLCNFFARKGYVTISLSYRRGKDLAPGQTVTDSIIKYYEAAYRAAQDARAAVRFIKQHSSLAGIDTNNIFVFGGSAGAITAMNVAYADKADIPNYYIERWGPLDGDDVYDYAGHSVRVKGVINAEGVITDTNYIDAGDPPLASLYGDRDEFYNDSTLLSSRALAFYNGQKIHLRANRSGVRNAIQTYSEGAHGSTFNSTNRVSSAFFMRDRFFEWLKPN
jgi:dienelactone hydrolase